MEGIHPLTDGDELLHSQVHPSFLQQGRVGSQAFRPTTKDQGQLSVSRGAMATAAEAFLLYTTELNLPSGGVWSVSVAECGAQDLPTYPDPLSAPVSDPAHAFIDFNGFPSNSSVERASKLLAKLATARGCQYP